MPLSRAMIPLMLLGWPGLALACSGPGAPAAIARNTLVGWLCFIAALALGAVAAAVLRRKGRRGGRMAWPLVLVLLHPGWWCSARSGDCGATLYWSSLAGLVLLGAVAAFVAVFIRPKP